MTLEKVSPEGSKDCFFGGISNGIDFFKMGRNYNKVFYYGGENDEHSILETGVLKPREICLASSFAKHPDRVLLNEHVLADLPADHVLATEEVVYWTGLRGETVILSQYHPGRKIEDLLVSKLASAQDRPKIERHDVGCGAIKSLVTMKVGISIALE